MDDNWADFEAAFRRSDEFGAAPLTALERALIASGGARKGDSREDGVPRGPEGLPTLFKQLDDLLAGLDAAVRDLAEHWPAAIPAALLEGSSPAVRVGVEGALRWSALCGYPDLSRIRRRSSWS